MRGNLLTVALLFLVGVYLTEANVLGWFEEGHPEDAGGIGDSHIDRPQGDDPGSSPAQRQVYAMLEAMKGSFGELANKRNSWYDRYDELADQASGHSAMITELLGISRIAMPIIWSTAMSNNMRRRSDAIKQTGQEVNYIPPNPANGELVPHPLRMLPTKLTDMEDFSINVLLKVNNEANVGIRLMYEPTDGVFDWVNDDIFFGVHLRWHFNWGPDREVALTDKYDGEFRTDSESVTPEAHWPDIKVGEKFAVGIQKKDKCFNVVILTGKQLYMQEPHPAPYIHIYCPKLRRTSRMVPLPRELRVAINEDEANTGGVEVYNIAWFPSTIA